jgi:hypothetical protein
MIKISVLFSGKVRHWSFDFSEFITTVFTVVIGHSMFLTGISLTHART